MEKLWLDDAELDVILGLVDAVVAEHRSGSPAGLTALTARAAGRLPPRVGRFLRDCAQGRADVFGVVSGFPVDDADLGPTPVATAGPGPAALPLRPQVYLRICAAVLGAASAPTGVLGRPAASRTSTDQVWRGWRTEPEADLVTVLCLRNPDDVATMVCAADWLDWTTLDVTRLSAPEYPQAADDGSVPVPERRPILRGEPGRAGLSVDPDRIERGALTAAAGAALDGFVGAVEEALGGFVLWPGDFAVIDNRRAVHGQEPFEPRADGTDPWFLQLTVAAPAGVAAAPAPVVAAL